MTTVAKFTKQSAEVLAYDIDYREWLSALSDTAVSVALTVDAGITKVSHTLLSGVLTIWYSGGSNAGSYKTKILLTTQAGRVKEDEIYIKIKDTV